jgi:hypothetical protein
MPGYSRVLVGDLQLQRFAHRHSGTSRSYGLLVDGTHRLEPASLVLSPCSRGVRTEAAEVDDDDAVALRVPPMTVYGGCTATGRSDR